MVSIHLKISQICSYCGANTGKKALNIRRFDSPHCNTKDIDRDVNASINIRNYGLGQVDNRNAKVELKLKF
jgi:putative transposase